MKRRDFYFLGFMACMVVYAASHRNIAHKTADKQGQKVEAEIKAERADSLMNNTAKVVEAGI